MVTQNADLEFLVYCIYPNNVCIHVVSHYLCCLCYSEVTCCEFNPEHQLFTCGTGHVSYISYISHITYSSITVSLCNLLYCHSHFTF